MRLGWWRAENGFEIMLDTHTRDCLYAWRSSKIKALAWSDAGSAYNATFYFSLVEFLRPLEDLPPALNSAVKAAEDRVRELKQMVDETQTAWATACRLHEAAQKELERLEKECEAKS